jgi:hypothetical protein
LFPEHSRAYKKNDQAFVEQKNGAVVRRLVGYGRFDGAETARIMARLYAVARLYVNFFQPSFKLKEKRREGAKVIKRYHYPATPYERALAHPRLHKAIKRRMRETLRTLDPVALLALHKRSSARASIVAAARAQRRCRRHHQYRKQPPLRRHSARRPRPASLARRTDASSGGTRPGFACPRCSTRTSP